MSGISEKFDPYYKWLAIAPEDQPPDLYRLLAVERFEDDPDVIEAAANQRMGHLRTYQSGKHSGESQKLLNEVAAAKIILLNPEKKDEYDKTLQEQMQIRVAGGDDKEISAELTGFLQQVDVVEQPAARDKPPEKPTAERKRLVIIGSAIAVGCLLVLVLIVRGIISGGASEEQAPQISRTSVDRQPGRIPPAPLPPASNDSRTSKPAPVSHEEPDSASNGDLAKLLARIDAGDLPEGYVPAQHQEYVDRVFAELDRQKSARISKLWREKQKIDPNMPNRGSSFVKIMTYVAEGEILTADEPSADVPDTADPSVEQPIVVGPPKTQPVPPTHEPSTSEPSAPEQLAASPKKFSVPSAAAQEPASEQLEQMYNLSKIKSPSEKLELAKELFKLGGQSNVEPVEKFVLLRNAMELAIGGRDAKFMLEVVDAIGVEFETDVLKVKGQMLRTFAGKADISAEQESLLEATREYVGQAMAHERYDYALAAAKLTYEACKGSSSGTVRKEAVELRDRAERLHKAMVALRANPDDPEANLIMGRLHCFSRNDWQKGLPYLMKGSDAELAALARLERAAPTESAAQIKLADGWWDLAERTSGTEKEVLLRRAGFWYEKAGDLSGLTRLRIDRRLEEIAKIEKPVPAKPKRPKKPTTSKQPKELAIDLPGGVKIDFVLIPAGEFMMGSSDAQRQLAIEQAGADQWAVERILTEGPQHKVKITKPFYLGKYEVTQKQWQAVMGNNPASFKDPMNPVETVRWEDVQGFVAKLNATFEKKGMMFGLPTEAQWEYACRAGTTTAYSFGDHAALLAQHGWSKGNSGGTSHPVGQGKPNAWGLYDMHGNVWEWCSDWYGTDYYAKSPPADPTGPPAGSTRMIRGGSWSHPPKRSRSAFRHRHPGSRPDMGLRLALVLAGK